MCEHWYIAAMLVTHLWPHTVYTHSCKKGEAISVLETCHN